MSNAALRKAGGSVMVTLPPAYLKQHGLSAGSVVELKVSGRQLVVTPGTKRLTLTDILAAAPKNARKQRVVGWDEMPPAGGEA